MPNEDGDLLSTNQGKYLIKTKIYKVTNKKRQITDKNKNLITTEI